MIASLRCARAWRRFLAACGDPLQAQAGRLRAILGRAEDTEVGRRLGFRALARSEDDLRLIREYQDLVPVRTYQAMREDLERVYAGDWRRLCPSRPIYFAMTAGSTGEYKRIPLTAEFRREIARGSLAFNGALEACHPELRGLRAQFLVGSAEGGRSPAGVPQGFVSGFNYKHLPWVVRRRFLVPYWVFTLDDADERAYAAGRILVSARRLGLLLAITPLNLVNLRRALERHAERLFADLASGTLTVRGASAVRGTFRARPDPALAAALRGAWDREGALPTDALFPSLRLLVCWQGGNMGYYLDDLDAAFGIDRHFDFPLSASEGIFAIPHRGDRAGGIVAITSHFLEFVPEEAPPGAAPRALRADELAVGASYRLVVTNSGGLYRYDMEDIVRVTGLVRCTPVIEFVSKAGRRVSVANERLTEFDVTVAMQGACRRCELRFGEFLFVPCSDRRYRVILDGAVLAGDAGRPREAALARLAVELECGLRAAAKGYDFEREDALLGPLEVVVTAPGELAAYLRRPYADRPLPNAQLKPVHLATEFDLHTAFTLSRAYAA